MPQTCSKCSRVNPAEAAYCYYDGNLLGGNGLDRTRGSPIRTGAQPFRSPFVFPSGKSCSNFDQLAMACQEEWLAAVDLLQQGYLEAFLGGLGRADLALAARQAARFPDQDRGLDQLLARLPTDVIEPPKLEVLPREVSLGLMQVGENRQLELHLANQGMRLLYGSISCEDCLWLAVGEAPGAPHKLFQFETELVVPIHIRGKELRAGTKPLQGRIVIESNGGHITVMVRAEVPVKPYPDGILAGACTPRQVAEKAKAAPKEAAALFERGDVARWYAANGWKYPVQGPSASGLGAVQQFFEALGLTPPPKVEISPRALRLQGNVGDHLQHSVEVKAQEKRPVYAYATSDQPWLEVSRARLNGRTATISLVVPTVPDREGETLRANVTITANGNQRFVVPVTLDVGGSFYFDLARPTAVGQAAMAVPVAAAPARPAQPAQHDQSPRPADDDSPAQRSLGKGWMHAAPAALLVMVLLLVAFWDLRFPPGDSEARYPGSLGNWSAVSLLDPEPRIAVQFMPATQRFGILVLKEPDPVNPNKYKRLTYHESGETNNTCVMIDGFEYLFGTQEPGRWARDGKRRILKGIELQPGRAWMSAMDYPESVRVTQTVMIIPNEQSQLLDTCLVHYQIENRSNAPHKIGIRVLIDTYIGANDGVPFTIPGQPGLLETMKKFTQKEIPDYIQALERSDLKDPGTIAQMGLKMPWLKLHADDPDLEPIQTLLICHWPDENGGSEARWQWPPRAMNDPPDQKKDSCVTLYWAVEQMVPKARRAMAFTYGLGRISSTESHNAQLSVTVGGSIRPNRVFTVTAYVKNPEAGQKARLHLPAGLALEEGQSQEQTVVQGRGDYSQVSWRVRAAAAGEYSLRVTSRGSSETFTVRVQRAGLFD